MKQTPNYIRSLLMPSTKAPTGRKAWSIDLENVWLPFFTATNLMGDTAIPYDALGAPIRLAFDKDGAVKFGRNGRPVTRIAKPLAQSVSLVRENFVANLKEYANTVATDRADEIAQQVKMAVNAGLPIIDHERGEIDKAYRLRAELAEAEALRQAEAEPHEAVTPPNPENGKVLATA